MKLKLLFLIHNLEDGGAQKVLVNLVNNMDTTKFDITVQALFAGGVNEQFLAPHIHYKAAFKKAFRGNSKLMKLFYPKTLHKKFIKDSYDIEVSYLEGPTSRIISGCPNTKTKLVSWVHCKIETPKEAAVGFRNFDEAKKCYSRFNNTVCVSKWVKDYFTNTLNFNKPIEVLYNTIESDNILRLSQDSIDVLLDNSKINLVTVGTLKPIKGYDRLLRILKRLSLEAISFHFFFLGIGPLENELKQFIRENDLEDVVTFLGYQTNPYKYISKMDLFICSSYSEGFSTAVTEALVVGTPVVTTLCSGMQELLGDNNEYGIVTENNEEALYEGIKRLLKDTQLLSYYKQKSAERGKMFSTENTVNAVEEMIFNL